MLAAVLTVAASAAVARADLYVELPVNLSDLSWRPSPSSVVDRLGRLLEGARELLANASVDCVPDGHPCAPSTGSCCEGLRCRGGSGGVGDGEWRCLGAADSEAEAEDRLRSLEAEGGGPMADSHPWAYSWEFQSKSDIEREETMFSEEVDWKRNWTLKGVKADDRWAKFRERIEQKVKKVKENVEGKVKNAWKNMKMWKKVNELKGKIVDRYKQKIAKKEEEKQPDITESPGGKESHEDKEATERNEKRLKTYTGDESHRFFINSIGHKEEDESVEGSDEKPESDESVIQFSDEIPKRKKKNRRLDFRIDDIIKDGVDLIADKIRGNGKSKKGHRVDLGKSLEKQLYENEEVDDTEDRLMKEIEELKRLRKERDEREKEIKKGGDDLDAEELIRRQVATILDEERKLERLRKIEQLKRMEQGGNRANKR